MRVERLVNAIVAVTEMTDEDKAKLVNELSTISEQKFIELEAVYVYEMY